MAHNQRNAHKAMRALAEGPAEPNSRVNTGKTHSAAMESPAAAVDVACGVVQVLELEESPSHEMSPAPVSVFPQSARRMGNFVDCDASDTGPEREAPELAQ